MERMEYTRDSVWKRAWKDSESFRKNSSFWFWMVELLGGLIATVVGALRGYQLMPSDGSGVQKFLFPTIGGAVGVLLGFVGAFILVFTWNLFRAPFKQRDEARILLGEIQGTIDFQRKVPLSVTETNFDTGVAGLYWRLRVDLNEGVEATGCRGDLIGAKCLTDPEAQISSGPLQWSRGSEMDAVTTLSVRKGQPRFLDVVCIDYEISEGLFAEYPRRVHPIRIVYAGGYKHRHSFSLKAGEYRFIVDISAKERGSKYCVCGFDCDGTPEHFNFRLLYSGTEKDAALAVFNDQD